MNNYRISSLPREISALVHHIELNRAGWWEKVIVRLVLSAIWLVKGNPDLLKIKDSVKKAFGYSINTEKLESILHTLVKEEYLVKISDKNYHIPEKIRTSFEKEIEEAEAIQRKAREIFYSLAVKVCPNLDPKRVWKSFERDLLIPLIRDTGANTYLLIAGEQIAINVSKFEKFFNQFGKEYKTHLKALVVSFLNPKNSDIRSFINRMLHVHFCVESCGLSEDVLKRIKNATKKPIRFRLFVDTNFLFSLLGLHENPSNTSARELKELLATLKGNPRVELYFTPNTLNEAKSAIGAAKNQVSGIPMSANFTTTVLSIGVSGLTERFFIERKKQKGQLSADSWFDLYLKDFITLAKDKGVKLYNENFNSYATRQDVIDDIQDIMDYEANLPPERRKSYEKIAHDVILWHIVKNKRPAYVESPIDAQEWILTVDFRFIGFDRHKMKTSESNIPICLHPTTLIQMLQFWIPRTVELEEAITAGLMLPFLFQEFDVKDERISLNIIKHLGRFEGSEDIPEDTLIKVVMNEGLRSRINGAQLEEEEIKYIRDTLVEELRLSSKTKKEKIDDLKELIREKEAALTKANEESKKKDDEINDLKSQIILAKKNSQATTKKLSELSDTQSQLEAKVAQMEKDKLKSKAIRKYLSFLSLLIVISLLGGWWIGEILTNLKYIIGFVSVYILSVLSIFIVSHFLVEYFFKDNGYIKKIWLFKQFVRFRKWLWGLLIAFLLSVIASLFATNIRIK